MKIVLASESLSRRALDLLGLSYEVCPSGIDESEIREQVAERLASRLAEAKARTVGDTIKDAIIVAGDAVVSKDGAIYEKPVEIAEAPQFSRLVLGAHRRVCNSRGGPELCNRQAADGGSSVVHCLQESTQLRNLRLHSKIRCAEIC